MRQLSRRRLLLGAAALGGTAITLGFPPFAGAVPERRTALALGPADADFRRLAGRGYNPRFRGSPEKIFLPGTPAETTAAVQQSLDEGLRCAPRSGGHCFADFVDSPENRAIIDLSQLTDVRYDEGLRAYAVGAGADLGTVYEKLFRGWGVTIPGGTCLGVGVGGHATGGGFGALSRTHGAVVDHLYGVEIVVVDKDGNASLELATRENNPELWWANTGGGGGNFGVVTRFLLRSRDSDDSSLDALLPKPPRQMLSASIYLPVADENSFTRFVGNYLNIFEQNTASGTRFADLFAALNVGSLVGSFSQVTTQLAADRPEADALHAEFVSALVEGIWPPPIVTPPVRRSFLDHINQVSTPRGPAPRPGAYKAAFLRKALSPDQIRLIYRYLMSPQSGGMESGMEFVPMGGAINSRPSDATAMPARDSFMTMVLLGSWSNPAAEGERVQAIRSLYSNLFATTGGVPVPGGATGGSYINYPDPDLRDPRYNGSGVPWHTLYYGANYQRLQQVKARWDPGNVFRHGLSIELP